MKRSSTPLSSGIQAKSVHWGQPEVEMAEWLAQPKELGGIPVATQVLFRGRMVLPAFDRHQTEFYLVKYICSDPKLSGIGFVSDLPCMRMEPGFNFHKITLSELTSIFLGRYIRTFTRAFYADKLHGLPLPESLTEEIRYQLSDREEKQINVLQTFTAAGKQLFTARVTYPDGESWIVLGVVLQVDEMPQIFIYEFDRQDCGRMQSPMNYLIGRMYNQYENLFI